MTDTADHTLRLRLTPEDRSLFDRAAKARGIAVTRLVLEAARQAAVNTLLDRTMVRVEAATFDAFTARLHAAASPPKRLRRTMRSNAPWAGHQP